MNGPILVTGATGFLGAHVLRLLAGATPPPRVRALVRRPEALDPSIRARLDVVGGDLRDRRAIATATEGARTVLHLAAVARAWSPDPEEFRAVNVGAVAALLAAARHAGVERFVHVSSVIADAPHRDAPLPASLRAPTPYEATKREGERLVAADADAGLHAVIVRPTRLYGPGPRTDANGVTRLLERYLDGKPTVRLEDGDVLANYVHVEDVARGILLAAAHGRRGAVYALGGENVPLRDLLALSGELAGVRHRVVAIPTWAGLAVGWAAEQSARFGRAPFITRGWVRTFLEDHRVDIGPARRDLGYAPRSLRDGLRDTIAWLHAERDRAEAA
ncbi:MAG: NAD-dependent epimerase/dehydratase family protein [Hyphomicrobiales bacterium]